MGLYTPGKEISAMDDEGKSSDEYGKHDGSESISLDPSRAVADAIAEVAGDAEIHVEDDQALVHCQRVT